MHEVRLTKVFEPTFRTLHAVKQPVRTVRMRHSGALKATEDRKVALDPNPSQKEGRETPSIVVREKGFEIRIVRQRDDTDSRIAYALDPDCSAITLYAC